MQYKRKTKREILRVGKNLVKQLCGNYQRYDFYKYYACLFVLSKKELINQFAVEGV